MSMDASGGAPRGLRPITNRSVVESVTEELRRSILSCELEPGQKLSLRQTADQLGVSFVPVREAFRSLEAQGLVVTEHLRSTRVAPLDPAQIHDIYRLRKLIEPDICARATDGHTDFTKLETLLEGLSSTSRTVDERTDSHMLFHLELMQPVISEWDRRVLDMLWNASQRYIRYAFNREDLDAEKAEQRRNAHAILIAAARSGDPEAVRRSVFDHLHTNEVTALSSLDAVGMISS